MIKPRVYGTLEGNTLHTFKGHSAEVNAVAFSPDGKTILTGSEDQIAILWDLDGNILQRFDNHFFDDGHAVTSVAFSPMEKQSLPALVMALPNCGISTEMLYKNLLDDEYDRGAVIKSVAFSPDGKTVVTGADNGSVILWDLKGNSILKEFKSAEAINSIAFSPDGKTILTGCDDVTAVLYDIQKNTTQEFKGHTAPVTSVAFSPDGKTILTGSIDNSARLWDLGAHTLQEFKGYSSWINSVAFSPDGKSILTGSIDKIARLWEVIMPLKDFLKSDKIEPLSPEQKKNYGIK